MSSFQRKEMFAKDPAFLLRQFLTEFVGCDRINKGNLHQSHKDEGSFPVCFIASYILFHPYIKLLSAFLAERGVGEPILSIVSF